MAWLKWFEKTSVELRRQVQLAVTAPAPLEPFDFDSLVTKGFAARLVTRFLFRFFFPVVFWILRTFFPILRLGRLVVVSRYADVRTVLENARNEFPVVYSDEMAALGAGTQGVLGLDGDAHDCLREALRSQLGEDDLSDIRQWAHENAHALLRAAGDEIDVMRDLITRTATEVCCRYFGITVQDPGAFAEWAMAISMQLFADPKGDANVFKQAKIGSVLINSLIDDAVDRAQSNHAIFLHGNPGTEEISARLRGCPIIERLLFGSGLAPDVVRAAIVGMATGFVPTNTLAAGNMLDELLRRPKLYLEATNAALALEQARAKKETVAESAALARLEQALWIAARFNPALSPGVWRHSPEGGTIDRDGTTRGAAIKAGSILMVSVYSGLRDRRMPETIAQNPARAAGLIFGHGPHACLGARIAMTQITEVFAALLAQPGLRPAKGKWGRIWRAGPFPVRFDMRFEQPMANRALIICAMRARDDVSRATIQSHLSTLGNPAGETVEPSCLATGCIDFFSINVIEADLGSDRSIILVEINGDGTTASLIKALANQGREWLGPVLAFCTPDGKAPPSDLAMGRMLFDAVLKLNRRPWGSTGLHFDGLGELSVADIDRQDRLAKVVRQIIDRRLSSSAASATRAMDVLIFARRLLRQDYYWTQRPEFRELMATVQQDEALLYGPIRPSRKRLRIADWQAPKSLFAPIVPLLKSRDGRPVLISLSGLAVAFGYVIYRAVLTSGPSMALILWRVGEQAISAGTLAWPNGNPSVGRFIAAVIAGTLGGPLAALALMAGLLGVLALALRRHERRDKSDESAASLEHLKAIAAEENARGFEQNHILAVMPIKRGALRRITFALTMWWIKQAVTFWFRPGFVVTMGTIHKARWFLIPGTRQFVFQSNYDGSWESYLEDFITRANEGQTSAWSHGEGFPPTRFLILDGASDGDRFKRWVRKQQRPSLCWYSRFPNLTAAQIRRNAMIEDGLARAASDTDARRWLAHFGSAQREPHELESQEAQALVFSGMPQHRHATTLAIRLPTDPTDARSWVRELLVVERRRPEGSTSPPKLARIGFGDVLFDRPVLSLGLTAQGLERLGLRAGRGLDQLPGAFALGMAARSRLLGDEAVAGWRWNDRISDSEHQDTRSVDAVIIVYGRFASEDQGDRRAHDDLVDNHVARLEAHHGVVVHRIGCAPPLDTGGIERPEQEHFGFRDGISQPVIRGSRKASKQANARDIVSPGEFLLGYRNDQGYLPPPIAIGAECDPRLLLPTVAESDANRYPRYGNRSAATDLRDFGRNGSFLVLRQLDQDVEEFHRSMQLAADQLNADYPLLPAMAGEAATAQWVAAKVIGRWPNGTPLVGNSARPGHLEPNEAPDNDFAYGTDDPRGFACPLGAHIRRTNPRDSLEPGDVEEQAITNRHRILRRGRTYQYNPDGKVEVKGLLFAALCSDIERQFEFVQQTWINARSFHGLSEETDPLLGNPLTKGGSLPVQPAKLSLLMMGGTNTRFTLPTASGPLVVKSLKSHVTVRGGGYFFLPSRSALQYLANLN